jgi:hypothetical protein
MTDPTPPLDPGLLEALRESPPAPSDARTRARARLTLALPGIGGGGAGERPSGGAGASGAASGALGSHAVVAIAFVLGGAAGAGLHAALTNTLAPRVVYVASSATVAPPTPLVVPSAVPSVPHVERNASTPNAVIAIEPPAGLAPIVPQTSASGVPQLTGERSLLDEVRASLVQGDANHALDRLHASRREFPHAILGEERDALTIEALVAARRYDEARTAADAFREHFPTSLFSGAVDAAKRSIP